MTTTQTHEPASDELTGPEREVAEDFDNLYRESVPHPQDAAKSLRQCMKAIRDVRGLYKHRDWNHNNLDRAIADLYLEAVRLEESVKDAD